MNKLYIDKIRSDFPILARKINGNKLVYLDNAATTQKPNLVIDSISDFYKNTNSNVHRGIHTLSIESTEAYELAREKIAKLINSPSSETVIWTRNTSESINLVAFTWGEKNISSGDNIVITPMEHHSNIVPWQQIAKKKDAEIELQKEFLTTDAIALVRDKDINDLLPIAMYFNININTI